MWNFLFAGIFLVMILGCSPEQKPIIKAEESYISCEAKLIGLFSSGGGKTLFGFTLTKENGKITKVSSDIDGVFTTDRLESRSTDKNELLFRQLILENDKFILLTEFPEREQANEQKWDTIIHNTGKFNRKAHFGWFEGECKESTKIF